MSVAAKPSVCLIGTSNGAFENGYVSAFRKSTEIGVFSKNCLGFSSSAIFSQRAEMIDLATFDICVLDFAANDAAELEGGNTPPELVRSVVSDAVRRVLAQGCLPALYIMPIRSQLKNRGGQVCQIYKEVAAEYRIPLFDGYSFVQHLKARNPDGPNLFRDNMHLEWPVAIQLAEAFIPRLVQAYQNKAPQEEIRGSGLTYKYHAATTFDVDASALNHRKTYIFETDTLTVPNDFILRLPHVDGGEITALGIDWANSSGSMEIAGVTSSNKKLTTMYSGPDEGGELNRMIFGISSVNPPVEIAGGEVKLLISGDADWRGRLELGALVIRSMADFCVIPLLPSPVIMDSFEAVDAMTSA